RRGVLSQLQKEVDPAASRLGQHSGPGGHGRQRLPRPGPAEPGDRYLLVGRRRVGKLARIERGVLRSAWRVIATNQARARHAPRGCEMVFGALFNKIKQGLAKTRGVFSGVASLFRLKGRVDRSFLDELEKRLYLADVGTAATASIVDRVRQAFQDKEITGDVETFVRQQLKELLSGPEQGIRWNAGGPTVIMIAGVNGSGKTTSIAKL